MYIAIDLKSFYASAECVDRGLDPLTTHLVVADESRTEKTICLAVSPSLKALGIPGRPRLFQVAEQVRLANARRRHSAPAGQFSGSSTDAAALAGDMSLEIGYVTAMPRMARYMEISGRIYGIYLKYVAPEDIHVYSIDEVFVDVGPYLKVRKQSAREMAVEMIREVLRTTGITATCGIAPNLYLCKVAMDIVAKHIEPDENGVRIAELDEMTYRRELWGHRPITDFWRVGPGIADRLSRHGIRTMGDVARCSLTREDLLYDLLGVNAELLIDHAWGWEPTTIADIKAYRPENTSIGSGQVLACPETLDTVKVILREMADSLALELVERGLYTDRLVLDVGYDTENLKGAESYRGEITLDRYGRKIPKHAHGTASLPRPTSSGKELTNAVLSLLDRVADPGLKVRRLNLSAGHLTDEAGLQAAQEAPLQLDLFSLPDDQLARQDSQRQEREREHALQQATLSIRHRFGKNALLKGTSLEEGATARERNGQIGGHKA